MDTTKLEGTVFDTFDEPSDSFRNHFSQASEQDQMELDYFWVAETDSGDYICQYDGKGNEREYSEVRELADRDELVGLYWVPSDGRKATVGTRTDSGSLDAELFRRGYSQLIAYAGTVRRICYVIRRNDKYCYIADLDTLDEEDEILVSDDSELDMETYKRKFTKRRAEKFRGEYQ
ncbi:MAG: hypothetical protein SVV03_02375 [Candidatus Nanohaloarchaea archaeon]|nr:hypothetical protein [Candidatus Nanohaloarchaea archaeon]